MGWGDGDGDASFGGIEEGDGEGVVFEEVEVRVGSEEGEVGEQMRMGGTRRIERRVA